MRPNEEMARFVRDALGAGRPRAEVAAALGRAGWAPAEVEGAMGAWAEWQDAEGRALPPVPRPRPTVSAREGFWYGLLFVALAVVSWHLVALAFEVIDALVPDVADTLSAGWAGYDRYAVRWSIAALLVFTPVVLWLGRRQERAAAADPGQRRSPVRQSLGHVALLLVALTLLGDLLAILYALLAGDLTARFALKALAVAAVAGAVFAYARALTREEAADAR